MEIFNKTGSVREYLNEKRRQGLSIGLVPTMGALHEGHMSLVEKAVEENDIALCTIYVNPTQFNNDNDFENYPVSMNQDLEMLEKGHCNVAFCPANEEIYAVDECIDFEVGYLDSIMEGVFRKGHFKGVARVVAKFFNITRPDRAYFGQKDLQQFVLIDNLNKSLKFDIELRRMPIVREADGLAMSSRNRRLDSTQRGKAVNFYKALENARELIINREGLELVGRETEKMFHDLSGVTLEYFEIVNPVTLRQITTLENNVEIALCIAGYVGDVRLIDNTIFHLPN